MAVRQISLVLEMVVQVAVAVEQVEQAEREPRAKEMQVEILQLRAMEKMS